MVRYIFVVVLVWGGYAHLRADYTTQAGTKAVFGKFDGAEADSAGEVSYKLSGNVTGVPVESLKAQDTVVVDTVYSLSALDSVPMQDSLGATSHDTVDYKFWAQNQGNLISDSMVVKAMLADTSNAGHFLPTYFRILDKLRMAQGGILSTDSVWYGVRLAEGAIDTFYVRTVVPGPQWAQDGESLKIQISIKDRNGLGTNDNWPQGKTVIDTSGIALHTHGDTLWDYGDTQVRTVLMAIKNAMLYVKSAVSKTSTVPGDTLVYAMYYDNDGSGATRDTVSIQQLLPKYVRYVPGSALGAYHTGESGTQVNFSSFATRTIFDKDASWANSVPDSVAGIKWIFGQNIGADDLDDTKGVADDTTAGMDGGSVKFKVIVK